MLAWRRMPGLPGASSPPRYNNVPRPVLTCWLLAGVLITAPFLVAALLPPPGRAFVGTFHWIDDFYNYVSFVQQAEDGHFLFRNKLRLEPHVPVLANLEWWTVGLLSRLCGRRPFLAYRLLALALQGALLLTADRVFRRAGLSPGARLGALALVATGGGLGGLLFEFTARPVFRCADLSIGVFPFFEALANPHWLAGTWLLLETLLALDGALSPRKAWRAVALGTVLGLVRPYDLVLAGLVHLLTVPLSAPPRMWGRLLLPLLGFLPVALYNYWVFFVDPTFSTYADTAYEMPPSSDFLFALGPMGLAALSSLRKAPGSGEPPSLRARLWIWVLVVMALIVVRPVSFTQQFVVGAGLPLLLLAGLGFSRLRPGATAALAVLSCSTAIVAVRVVSRPDPSWHVPAERLGAARALRAHCRPGDLVLAPPDVGLYTIGLTACHAFVSHAWAPGHKGRDAAARTFYGEMSPAERRAWLERMGVTFLVLPGDPGEAAPSWLGEEGRYAQVARRASPSGELTLYARRR